MATGDTMTFVINDASTGGNNPSVKVTITENGDGTLSFKIEQLAAAGAYIGDLRGFFFDLPAGQEGALAGMTATNQVKNPDGGGTGTQAQIGVNAVVGNDNVMSAGGNSNNMNGLNSGGDGYDFGLEIGSEGVGKNGDDVRAFSFTLDATKNLTLADFANATFGVRVMSVGMDVNGDGSIDTARNGSSKIGETTFTLVQTVNDDTGCVDENATLSGNIFTNDTKSATLDVMTVTSAKDSGGNAVILGTAQEIVDDSGPNAGDDAAGATITLNADGSWSVDASTADALSEGEHITQTFTINVRQDHYTDGAHLNLDGSYSTTETFTVSVCGVNDGPEAKDDDFTSEEDCMDEDGSLTANVLADNGNGADSDVDRLDTIMVTGIYDKDGNLVALGDDGEATVTLASGATVTIHSDGSFTYDTNGAFTTLTDGQMQLDSFVYELSDNNDATSEATATVCIDGEGPPGGGGPGNQPPDAVDDPLACVSQVEAATSGVTGSVLDNDTDPDADPLTVTSVNGQSLVNGVANIILTDAEDNEIGTLEIHEDGSFTFLYTGPYSDEDLNPTFTYTISDGHDGTDTATVTLCLEPLENPGRGEALSPGGWTNPAHSLADSENLPSALAAGTLSFDDFFNLDDGLNPVTNRTWTDNGTSFQDLTLSAAFRIGTGQGNGGDSTTPNTVAGNELALARQASVSVANFYDDDGQDDFVAAYIYQRAISDNNDTLADNPYDEASVLADLKMQVHDAFEGATGAYSIDTLTNILNLTHEA